MKRLPKIGQRVIVYSTEGSFIGDVVSVNEVSRGLEVETTFKAGGGQRRRVTVPMTCVRVERKYTYIRKQPRSGI